jgi:hypothetical protein
MLSGMLRRWIGWTFARLAGAFMRRGSYGGGVRLSCRKSDCATMAVDSIGSRL